MEYIRQISKNLWEVNIPDKLKGIITQEELKKLTNEALGKIFTEHRDSDSIEIDEGKTNVRPANQTNL